MPWGCPSFLRMLIVIPFMGINGHVLQYNATNMRLDGLCPSPETLEHAC